MTENWRVVYEEAVLEDDWSRMEERLVAAESAIRQRLHELPLGGGTLKENLAIADALSELKSLRNEGQVALSLRCGVIKLSIEWCRAAVAKSSHYGSPLVCYRLSPELYWPA